MSAAYRNAFLCLVACIFLATMSVSFASEKISSPAPVEKAEAITPPQRKTDAISRASVISLPDRPIRIARIILPELPSTIDAIDETVRLITEAFKPHPVEFEVLESVELENRIKSGSVDAFIASPGYYWRMTQHGVNAVGTLISKNQPDPNNATALAFLVHANDHRFNELYDLKDHVIGSTFATAFSTFRIGLAEIAKLGENPESFFSQTVFTDRTDIDEIVSLLDNGYVDAVSIKACWLEEQPPEVQARYRVLSPHYGGITCKHSSDTYPGIMMAVTQGAHPVIAHVVARTILSHPLLPDQHRWAVATDMRSVDNVYRLLKIENYAYLREMTLQSWLSTHWQVPVIALLIVLGLILHGWRSSVLVRKRTKELTTALIEQDKAQKEILALSERMESLHKVTVVGQLSSMIAHELAQPLAVIQYYCESQRDILKAKPLNERLLEISRVGIEKALARTHSIVDKVRSYNRGYTARDDAIELQPTIKRVCCTLNAELLEKTNFHLVCPPKLLVRADKLELELMLSNLLKNALEASNETPYPVVTLEAFSQDKKIFIRIENSGRLLTEDDVRRLTTPLLTTKATGLGLGVTIACALAEACGGQVQFKARPEGGLIAFITLLDAKNAPEHRSST